jgi:hypothetical protein
MTPLIRPRYTLVWDLVFLITILSILASHCDCEDLHAEIKLCVEGLNIAVERRRKQGKKVKMFEGERMKMELQLIDIVHKQKMIRQVEDEEY